MIVLHPNQSQYNDLNGYNNNNFELLFVKDYSDKWIVGLSVLDEPNFKPIHDQLEQLERIEFTPFPNIEP
jgi:hypothetical protein